MLYQSGEDYLETILILHKENGGVVRSIDIASKLGYSKPSISRAMSNLKKAEYIEMDSKGYITFTKLGLETAQSIYNRHLIITNFLQQCLGIDEETADCDACKIEHVVSELTFCKMKEFLEKNNFF